MSSLGHRRVAAAMAFGSIVSVQFGAAAATTLFDSVGALGAVFLRSLFGALLLWALARGSFRPVRWWPPLDVVLFGVAFALVAGGFWGAYIVLSARVGAAYPGMGAAAAAAVVSALVLAPAGLLAGGADLLDPRALGVGLAVGLLSSAVPYALEMEALRRLPQAVFGVLMSLEPAVAAAVGFLALSQGLAAAEVAGIACVVAASAGALRGAAATPPPD